MCVFFVRRRANNKNRTLALSAGDFIFELKLAEVVTDNAQRVLRIPIIYTCDFIAAQFYSISVVVIRFD